MREGEMTPQQRWVLSALNDRPRQDADSIARTMFMGMRDAKDALVQLGERGLVSTADGHCYELTAAGCDERQRVRARSVAFEKDEWAGESPAEIAIVRRVLGRLIDKSPSGN
jgi:DNA-binding MarR family transcriptional regulator